MQQFIEYITKYKKILLIIATIGLLFTSILSVFYFIPPYTKTNSSGFHGGGYDFLAYYSVGEIAKSGETADIYNPESLKLIQDKIISNNSESQGFMTYLNPPYFAFFLIPLSFFNVGEAQILWLSITIIMASVVAYTITKKINANKKYQIALFFVLITSFPFWQNYRQGQLGILLLFFILLSINQYNKKRYFFSGALLSILFIKPHIAVLAIIGLLLYKKSKVIYGMLLATVATIIIFLPFTGINLYFDYAKHLLGVTESHANGAGSVVPGDWEGSLGRTYGINGAITKLFGQNNYTLVNTLSFLAIAILTWLLISSTKRNKILISRKTKEYFIITLVVFGLLINPHLYAYDLVYSLSIILILYNKKILLGNILIFIMILQLSAIDYIVYMPVLTSALFILILYLYRYNVATIYTTNTRN